MPQLTFQTRLIVAFAAFATAYGQPGNLKHAVQKQMDQIVEKFAGKYPDLALSLAWKNASHELALVSGKVSGRFVTTQDTFLYGSGTKPITATAVLRLIDQGRIKATDKVTAIVDPYLRAHQRPTLVDILGEAISKATVLDLIRMNAGIRDYEDNFSMDQATLINGSKFWDIPYDALEFSVSPANIQAGLQYKGVGNGTLYCDPGTCTAYSSTSFQVAGLVLLAVLQPESEWFDFDLGDAVFEDRHAYPSLSFPPLARRVRGVQNMSDHLSTPGISYAKTWETTTIYEQNPSILGWTCGNMIASPKDVAKFYYHLLDTVTAHGEGRPLLSDASRAEMTKFKALTTGWGAGYMQYGAGMMHLNYGSRSDPIWVTGHEGDTFGFVSSQGYVPSLGGAYSVVSNIDVSGPMESMTYELLRILSSPLSSDVVIV